MLVIQGVVTIFERFFGARISQKLRRMTYVECAVAGERRKWLTGCRLCADPEELGRTEVQVALRLISAARRVD
jgi:hypothetical protein